jgi:hypothetical protein
VRGAGAVAGAVGGPSPSSSTTTCCGNENDEYRRNRPNSVSPLAGLGDVEILPREVGASISALPSGDARGEHAGESHVSGLPVPCLASEGGSTP